GTVIKRRAYRITVDHHRVHHAVDVGEQAVGGDQRRMHAQLEARFGAAGHTQMLDPVAQGLGIVDVGRGQLGDALGIGLVELQRHAEGNGGEDGQPVGGVDAFDVERRIRLGIAQCLSFLEHVFEGAALLAHLGEYEVTGAIDDAGQPVDTVGRQPFADRLDHWNAARHRSLEGDDDALLAGTGENLVAMHSDQRLVGGDHVLAVLDGLEHQFEGQGIAADQLDDDIDLGVTDNGENIVGNGNGAGVALGVELPGRDLRNLNSTPGTA